MLSFWMTQVNSCLSNSVSLQLTFIAANSPTTGNKNGFNTWQHKHNMTDFRNLTSICCAGKSVPLTESFYP